MDIPSDRSSLSKGTLSLAGKLLKLIITFACSKAITHSKRGENSISCPIQQHHHDRGGGRREGMGGWDENNHTQNRMLFWYIVGFKPGKPLVSLPGCYTPELHRMGHHEAGGCGVASTCSNDDSLVTELLQVIVR